MMKLFFFFLDLPCREIGLRRSVHKMPAAGGALFGAPMSGVPRRFSLSTIRGGIGVAGVAPCKGARNLIPERNPYPAALLPASGTRSLRRPPPHPPLLVELEQSGGALTQEADDALRRCPGRRLEPQGVRRRRGGRRQHAWRNKVTSPGGHRGEVPTGAADLYFPMLQGFQSHTGG